MAVVKRVLVSGENAASSNERDLDADLVARAEAAGKRWYGRRDVRERRQAAATSGKYIEAESADRLVARVNRLVAEARRKSRDIREPSSERLRDLLVRPALTVNDINDAIVEEAVIDARDFLSVEFLERGLFVARSVGRIVRRSGAGVRPRGTGFLVGPGLLLTNEHVLPTPELASECLIEMDYELNVYGPPKPVRRYALQPLRFFLADGKLDFALVAVAPRALVGETPLNDYGFLPLDGQQGKISLVPHDMINVVQHPLGREKEIVIRNNRVVDLRTGPGDEEMGPFLHYEADTEKGSSGSPVFNDQWEVVALHHSGVPRRDKAEQIVKKDGDPWRKGVDPVESIAWEANEGVRISSIVGFIERAPVDAQHRQLLDRLLSAQAPGVFAVQSVSEETGKERDVETRSPVGPDADSDARREPSGRSSGGYGEFSRGEGRLTFDLPLRISIELGLPARTERGLAIVKAESPAFAERMRAEDYADRAGYVENFLGSRLPLPRLKRSRRFGNPLTVSSSAANPFELKYHHYSVIMNEERRLAYLSAVNVDFRAPFNASREQGTGSWRLDPRIGAGAQLGNAYYANNDYDKGHLTRRDDAAWGRSLEEAVAANNDTFHYPNAAPQYFAFNQSDEFTHLGLDLWGDLENFISSQGGRDLPRMCVFNGPIFGVNDKPLQDIFVPLEYFKIVVFKNRGESRLRAVGFVLSQADLIGDLAEEKFEVGRFQVRQRSIAAISRSVDVDFRPLAALDRLQVGDGTDESLDDSSDVPILKLTDIVL